ncbi:MAG: hypothetical protein KDE33_17010 [Bacteroidetes bacterium]|nr:hypothetical protein [Bacteroidota bacterium]
MKKNYYQEEFIKIFNELEKETQEETNQLIERSKGVKIAPTALVDVNLIDILLFLFSNISSYLIAYYFYRKDLKKKEKDEKNELEELQQKTKSLEFQVALKERKIEVLQTSFVTLKKIIANKSSKLSENEIKKEVIQEVLDTYGEIDKRTEKLVNKVVESYREYFDLS